MSSLNKIHSDLVFLFKILNSSILPSTKESSDQLNDIYFSDKLGETGTEWTVFCTIFVIKCKTHFSQEINKKIIICKTYVLEITENVLVIIAI